MPSVRRTPQTVTTPPAARGGHSSIEAPKQPAVIGGALIADDEVYADDSRLLRARALVLRSVDYTNTSQVLTLLTHIGLVSAYARGSRRKNNHLRGPISELSVIDAVMQVPKSADTLYPLLESQSVRWPRREDWELSAYLAAEYLREVLLAIPVAAADANVVSDVVLVELDCLRDGASACRVAAEFSAWMLKLNGLQPELDQCVVSGRRPSGKVPVAFSYSENGLLSPSAAAGKAGLDQIGPGALVLLKALFSGNQERIDDVQVQTVQDWLVALRVSTRLLSLAVGRELKSLPGLLVEVRRSMVSDSAAKERK